MQLQSPKTLKGNCGETLQMYGVNRNETGNAFFLGMEHSKLEQVLQDSLRKATVGRALGDAATLEGLEGNRRERDTHEN